MSTCTAPSRPEYLLNVLPETVKNIAVLDRCKEPGALGEPLYLDVVTALAGTKFGPFPSSADAMVWAPRTWAPAA